MDTNARLSLALLGGFEVTLDGRPISFESVKVRAMLAYLAVEAGRSHARAFLAELLWPDLPAATALTYLRHVLGKLKEAIPNDAAPDGPPFLLVTRETVALNPGGDYTLDVAAFTALLEACAAHPHRHPETCVSCARRRAAAVALYRGDFLAHFLLGDSVAFEEWAALKRERLRQQIAGRARAPRGLLRAARCVSERLALRLAPGGARSMAGRGRPAADARAVAGGGSAVPRLINMHASSASCSRIWASRRPRRRRCSTNAFTMPGHPRCPIRLSRARRTTCPRRRRRWWDARPS